jgi:AbrB family looped-hinge helix DNA binding protein
MESSITTNGQVAIPKAIRDRLGLKPGDRVKFFIGPGRSAVLWPKLRATSLRGVAGPTGRQASLAQMDDAIASAAAARFSGSGSS